MIPIKYIKYIFILIALTVSILGVSFNFSTSNSPEVDFAIALHTQDPEVFNMTTTQLHPRIGEKFESGTVHPKCSSVDDIKILESAESNSVTLICDLGGFTSKTVVSNIQIKYVEQQDRILITGWGSQN